MRLFRKKGKAEEELPDEFERIRRELHAPKKVPNPDDVPEDELGEPVIPEQQEITLPRRERDERPFLPPGLEPLTGPAPEPRRKHEEEPRHGRDSDRLDLIMSKLDTIDARLKLIEEKLKRF